MFNTILKLETFCDVIYTSLNSLNANCRIETYLQKKRKNSTGRLLMFFFSTKIYVIGKYISSKIFRVFKHTGKEAKECRLTYTSLRSFPWVALSCPSHFPCWLLKEEPNKCGKDNKFYIYNNTLSCSIRCLVIILAILLICKSSLVHHLCHIPFCLKLTEAWPIYVIESKSFFLGRRYVRFA